MKAFEPARPVCFISPHLDDIVLSCGYFLHKNPGTTVITVLAGAPDRFTDQTEWNARTTGEYYAPDAMKKRRKEDTSAMNFLNAKAIYLDGLDFPYLNGQARDEKELSEKILATVREAGFKSVVMPIGFHHPDHISIGKICQRLAKKIDGEVYFYMELPYGIAFPKKVLSRLKSISSMGKVEELKPLLPEASIKDRAFRLYKSQYIPIKEEFSHSGTYDKSLESPERYWRFSKK